MPHLSVADKDARDATQWRLATRAASKLTLKKKIITEINHLQFIVADIKLKNVQLHYALRRIRSYNTELDTTRSFILSVRCRLPLVAITTRILDIDPGTMTYLSCFDRKLDPETHFAFVIFTYMS